LEKYKTQGGENPPLLNKQKTKTKMAQTEMKQINGFENYFIDTDGNVFTDKRGELKKLKPSKKKTGYLYTNIYWGKKLTERASLRIHRVVYETFVGPIPEGFVVDHINDIKDDNRLENLQLLTPKENTIKYWETELARLRKK
jgi:hypothetical protein